MKKTSLYISLSLVAIVLFASVPTQAAPKKGFSLPEEAQQVAHNVFYLGSHTDGITGEQIEGYAIIHKKGEAKNNASRPGGSTTCYAPLAKGAKWKAVEPWVMNTSNTRGLPSWTVYGIMVGGINKWEAAAQFDILGNGATTTAVLLADSLAPDNINEVYFGPIDENGVIGVTTVWGVFSGPTLNRRLVEWDMIFDDTDFDWSVEAGGVGHKMDFDNIATHELGHAIGLSDIYTSSCSAVTMFGYANEGETNKRTLEQGDIIGINELY